MRIVVLAGGTSTERDVSISSGILVADALRKKGHEVVLLDIYTGYEKDILDVDELFKINYSFTDKINVGETISDIDEVKENRRDKSERYLGESVIDICDFADITFLALHGGAGENGQVQAAFDLLGIKYTGSGYFGSALAMNKGLTKSVLIQKKVLTPYGEIFKTAEDAQAWNRFPCVVKPCSGGSSVGINIVTNADDYANSVKEAFGYGESDFSAERRFLQLKSFPRKVSTTIKQSIRRARLRMFALPTSLPRRMKNSERRLRKPSERFILKTTPELTSSLTPREIRTASRQTLSPV